MHVKEILRRYGAQRDVGASTLRWLQIVVARYGRHLGREAMSADLDDATVNDWCAAMLAAGELARSTIHGYRRGLLILWRFAVEHGFCDNPPVRLRRIKVPPKVPIAWTHREMGTLVASASSLTGKTKAGLPRNKIAVALVMVAWDSGLRLSDLLKLRFADVDRQGNGAVIQGKTGNPILFRLSPSTLASLEEIRSPRRSLIFGDVASRKAVFFAMRAASLGAGLSGGTKKIRKSGATAIESEHPGAAMGYLGHRTPDLAYKHYVDPRLIQQHKPSPPPIEPPTDAA